MLVLGSLEVASAVTSKHGSLPVTKAIKACATNGGSLRLAKGSGRCPHGTSKVALARSATAPQALALDISSGTQSKTLPLLAGTKLKAKCATNVQGSGNEGSIDVVRNGKTQIDGTSFLVQTGSAQTLFVTNSGGGAPTPTGADSVYSPLAGGFFAQTDDGYATLNTHLLVTVPGAVFTIDAIVDVNFASAYCRVSAEVDSATT